MKTYFYRNANYPFNSMGQPKPLFNMGLYGHSFFLRVHRFMLVLRF